MMKKGVLVVFGFALLFMNSSCMKNGVCKDKSVDSERSTILAYAAANGINVTESPNHVFYEVINPGIGATANANSTVKVKYLGKLTNGTIFDDHSSSETSINLSQVIKGWSYGIPLIQEGGIIKLIIPSSLGYGCTGFGSVPEHSILYFYIELTDVI